jgi:soluble lytic murein transglycosylase-like protein
MMVIGTTITVGNIRQWRPHRAIAAALVSGLLATVAVISNVPGAQGAPPETAVQTPRLGAAAPAPLPADLPAVLSPADAALYPRIFAAQAAGDWALADRLVGELKDQRLLGYVLAERYTSPRFKPTYGELVAWLRSYADLPDAGRIHALALKHRPPHAPAPPPPTPVILLTGSLPGEIDAGWAGSARAPAPAAPKAAAKAPARGKASAPAAAKPDDAAADASVAARHTPHAAWVAGLAAWRSGQPALAIKNFEAVATSPASTTWNAAAGAFWAARGYLVTRKPELYVRWMSRAAANNYTFYGMLAHRALGRDINIDWSLPAIGRDELSRFEPYPGAGRALALIQLGERARAEDELRRLYPKLPNDLAPLVLTMAERGGMPGLAMRIAGKLLYGSGQRYDAGLYPVPPWLPAGGFTLNRALIYAIARIESGFNPTARNPSGAAGLMQLMPGTARVMGKGHAVTVNVLDPEHNLTLGQRYVDLLLAHERVKGNLLSLVAAYNVGPGNLTPSPGEDPLLLIESLPSAETRQLVQRVLTNFWIYQLRLGQPTDSLDQVAQGDMPVYMRRSGSDAALAERNGRN